MSIKIPEGTRYNECVMEDCKAQRDEARAQAAKAEGVVKWEQEHSADVELLCLELKARVAALVKAVWDVRFMHEGVDRILKAALPTAALSTPAAPAKEHHPDCAFTGALSEFSSCACNGPAAPERGEK